MTDQTQAFGEIASFYKSARPTYPGELIGILMSSANALDAGVPRLAVDVGAGTGIATRQVASALGPVWRCVAVEPGEAMRNIASEDLTPLGIEVAAGTGEDFPVDDGSVGLLLAAQAVQWFDRPRFYAEATRVLAPQGLLALIENNRSWRTSSFLDDYESLLEELSPGYSRFYRDFDYISELAAAGFSNAHAYHAEWVRTMTPSAFEEMAMSSTKMRAAVESTGDSNVRERLAALFHDHGIEQTVDVPYRTDLLIVSKGQP